jgi:DNA repair exonuclease SbcCD ATPase subunit
MKRKFIRVSCALLVCLGWFASIASAQLFGSDDRKSERILLEIKKLNTRIVEKVLPQIQNTNSEIEKIKAEINQVKSEINRVKSGNKSVSQNMEMLSNIIPGMQGTIEQGQVQTMQEVQSLGTRLAQLEAQIKADRENSAKGKQAELDAIKQEVNANLKAIKQEVNVNLKNFKEGMAKDIERMAQLNEGSIQELVANNQKNFGLMEKQIEKHLRDQNVRVDKSIAVMTEMAKGGSKTNETLASLQAGVMANSKSLSEQNKKIIDILSKTLQEQETASTKIDSLGGNQSKSDENVKFTRETMVALKDILDKRLVGIDNTQQALQAQNDKSLQNVDLIKQNLLVADQKINKLAEVLKAMQNQQQQGSEVGKAKVELINEKITRLIEILKAIAAEQGKMEKLVASQGGKGNTKELIDALADLKRKANVNISRSDSILKKLKK